MITKEYECAQDGPFEGIAPVCPRCGKIGRRTFRTPPGVSTGAAARFDRKFEALVRDRGLTNYSTIDKNKLSWTGHLTAQACQGQWVRPGTFGVSTGRRDANCSFEEYASQPFQAPKFQKGVIQSDGHGSAQLPPELVNRTRNQFTDPRGDPKI